MHYAFHDLDHSGHIIQQLWHGGRCNMKIFHHSVNLQYSLIVQEPRQKVFCLCILYLSKYYVNIIWDNNFPGYLF